MSHYVRIKIGLMKEVFVFILVLLLCWTSNCSTSFTCSGFLFSLLLFFFSFLLYMSGNSNVKLNDIEIIGDVVVSKHPVQYVNRLLLSFLFFFFNISVQ